jgi:hypothetical protein
MLPTTPVLLLRITGGFNHPASSATCKRAWSGVNLVRLSLRPVRHLNRNEGCFVLQDDAIHDQGRPNMSQFGDVNLALFTLEIMQNPLVQPYQLGQFAHANVQHGTGSAALSWRNDLSGSNVCIYRRGSRNAKARPDLIMKKGYPERSQCGLD